MEEILVRVVMIFIDGIGLGDLSPANPFVFAEMPRLRAMLNGNPLTAEMAGFQKTGVTLLGLDASLGVAGLPQSATGQASLFTGINAAFLAGRHLSGFPNSTLRSLLANKGIFGRLKSEGFSCVFANAYRPPFFEALALDLPGRFYSCSTLITYYGGLSFYNLDDLREGRALYMDLDHTILRRMGFDLPEITPEEAGDRLFKISRGFDFTLFEYFLSDLAGHKASREEAIRVLTTLDRFLGTVVAHFSGDDTFMIITSDHGNLEDLSHRRHTANLVPALLIGPQEMRCGSYQSLSDLTGILSLVLAVLKR